MSSKTKRWLVQSAIGQDGRGAPQSVSDAYVTWVLIIPQRRRNHGLLLRVLSQRNNFLRVAAPSWERKGIWAKFQQICTVTFKSTSGGEAKRWKAQRSPFPGLRHWHPWTWKNQQKGSRGENHPSGLAATPAPPKVSVFILTSCEGQAAKGPWPPWDKLIQGFLLEPAASMPATITAGEALLFYVSGDLKLPHPGPAAQEASTHGNKKQQERQAKWKLSSPPAFKGLPWWLRDKESACNVGDACSIPGSGRSPENKMAAHSNILAWRIPWAEEPGGLHSPWDCKELDTT